MTGRALSPPSACVPFEWMFRRLVMPSRRSWTQMSIRPFVSPPTRLVAADSKVTHRPLPLIDGLRLNPWTRLGAGGVDADAHGPDGAGLVEDAVVVAVAIVQEDVEQVVAVGGDEVRGARLERDEAPGGADRGALALAAERLRAGARDADATQRPATLSNT